jgi:hypothetical protein
VGYFFNPSTTSAFAILWDGGKQKKAAVRIFFQETFEPTGLRDMNLMY